MINITRMTLLIIKRVLLSYIFVVHDRIFIISGTKKYRSRLLQIRRYSWIYRGEEVAVCRINFMPPPISPSPYPRFLYSFPTTHPFYGDVSVKAFYTSCRCLTASYVLAPMCSPFCDPRVNNVSEIFKKKEVELVVPQRIRSLSCMSPEVIFFPKNNFTASF